jgi:hypothetical protein
MVLLVVLVALDLLRAPHFAATSLGELLELAGIRERRIEGLAESDRARPVTSYAIAGEGAPLRAVAFYFADDVEGGLLPQDFWLVTSSERGARARKIRASDAGLEQSPGSLLRIDFTSDFIVVGGHWTPSAAPAIVVRRESLAPVGSFSGWVLAALGGNRVVYSPSMVHFAPTHPQRVRIRNLETGEDREIYPIKPESELWRGRVAHVAALYRQWGERLGNHHGDPTQFDLSVRDSLYDGASDTLVLVLDFAAREPNGLAYSDGLREVGVLYRNVTGAAEAEEAPLEELLKRHGAASVQQLVRKP